MEAPLLSGGFLASLSLKREGSHVDQDSGVLSRATEYPVQRLEAGFL